MQRIYIEQGTFVGPHLHENIDTKHLGILNKIYNIYPIYILAHLK